MECLIEKKYYYNKTSNKRELTDIKAARFNVTRRLFSSVIRVRLMISARIRSKRLNVSSVRTLWAHLRATAGRVH